MKRIFLDHAATTPTDPRVVEAMLPYFSESFGNPSSIHSLGLETRTAVAEAREKVASLIGAASDEIIFTSGGTEADNLAIKGVAQANAQKGKHIVTTRIEHHAVEESCRYLEKQGFKVTHVGVDQDGLVDPRDVEKAVTPETILISVMHANNEVGTIQPIAEISRVARNRGVYFHTDAVQTVGHIPAKVDDLGVDLLAISAHKLYGPKGVGVLYVRKGTRIVSFMHGGGQERGLRASTENVPGIVGFGKAAEIAQAEMDAESRHVTRLRDRLIKGLLERIPQVRLNGHPTQTAAQQRQHQRSLCRRGVPGRQSGSGGHCRLHRLGVQLGGHGTVARVDGHGGAGGTGAGLGALQPGPGEYGCRDRPRPGGLPSDRQQVAGGIAALDRQGIGLTGHSTSEHRLSCIIGLPLL